MQAPRHRDDPVAILSTADNRPDMSDQGGVLLMEREVVPICYPGASVQLFKGRNDPMTVLVEQEQTMQLLQGLHAPGKGFLQSWLQRRTETVALYPVRQAGQDQVCLLERVLSLLGHGPGKVGGGGARRLQIVATRLFQLQKKQATQAQADRKSTRLNSSH